MELNTLQLAERFMKYVRIDTQSDPDSASFPSTEKQKDLSKILVEELQAMGIKDAQLDEYGYVMATIPSTISAEHLQVKGQDIPVICFCAHVDTAPDCSGTNVQPILHKNYNGTPIVLPSDSSQVITMDAYPYLKEFVGSEIITASGNTLLGADDKAGVTIIMELAQYLMKHKNIIHGPV